AVEPAPDELAFPGVEIGQDLLDALDTPTVMRVVVPGEKARLRLPQVAGRRMKTGGPAGGRRPAGQVKIVVQERPTAVFEEDPESPVSGLPPERVEVERPEPLRGKERLIHLEFAAAVLELERAHRPRGLRLMVRVQVLEEDAKRLVAVERDAQALGMETRARRRERPPHRANPDGSSPQARPPLLEGLRHQRGDPVVARPPAQRARHAKGGVASATRPRSNCSCTSHIASVLVRWVIRNAVRPRIRRSMASRIAASVFASTALVGSSRIRNGASLRNARASATR